jgi:acetyltransferase
MPADHSSGIRSFFEPRSVAVAGASTDPNKLGSVVFANLLANVENGSLKASVYALNPGHDRIGTQRCYATISSLPETPELLIVAVPVSLTVGLVKEAAEVGVKAVIMVTSGFAEAGRAELEAEILRATEGSGMRILGPNTIGLLDTRSGVDSLFLRPTKTLPDGSEVVSLLKPLKGDVTILTQSGHLGEIISEELAANGVGIRALVGTGNQLDVSVEDVIEYFADDKHTKVITLYLEGVSDGRRFLQVATRAAKKKPVVVFKVGKTEVGARAAFTHTASMVGDYELYKAAFQKSGLVEAQNFQELIDFSVALSMLPSVAGRRLMIITNAGGVGVVSADEATKSGLEVKPLSSKARRRLRSEFRNASLISNAVLNNPIDLTASATTDEIVKMTESVLGLPECDLALVLPTHQTPTIAFDISTRLATVVSRTRKPVCMCVMGRSELASRIHDDFSRRGIPSFPTPERAIRALSAVVTSRRLRFEATAPGAIRREDLLRGLDRFSGLLPQPEAAELLRAYGIAEPASAVVRSLRDLTEGARVGFPVACKLLSSELIHKTQAGGVILDVKSWAALTSAFHRLRRLAASRGLRFEGMLVQHMAEPGVETILGGASDPTFGPTVLFGAGGTLAELVHDVALSIAPVNPREAMKMVAGTKMGPLLRGYKGGLAVDLDELCGAISRFSRILVDNPSVAQLEVNPLIVTENGPLAVDTRVVVSGIGSQQRATAAFKTGS